MLSDNSSMDQIENFGCQEHTSEYYMGDNHLVMTGQSNIMQALMPRTYSSVAQFAVLQGIKTVSENMPIFSPIFTTMVTSKLRNSKVFRRIEKCEPNLAQLNPRTDINGYKTHFLINIPIKLNSIPEPYPLPGSFQDYWNDDYVKMPYSSRNKEWHIIQSVLRKGFKSMKHLENSIKEYNRSYSKKFKVLEQFSRQYSWRNTESILKSMSELALDLPKIVTKSVPLLKRNSNSILFLSQYQIASLLANAFFCTFPRRSRHNAEYQDYPLFNFVSLFTIERDENRELPVKIEKLKCIFNYFEEVVNNRPNGVVTFERRSLRSLPRVQWNKSDKTLTGLRVEEGTIEKEGKGYSEVDFANKYIGGGVLASGAVQEELRFLMCPELIVSRLFTEVLLNSEALVITGCTQYNKIKGYSNDFKFCGEFKSDTKRDKWGRYCTQVIAMDAIHFPYKNDPEQFSELNVLRNLNKVYCAFYCGTNCQIQSAIASGKWGCGAFNGDPYLSSLIQLMAASQVDRNLILFVMNDIEFMQELEEFYEFALHNNMTIMELYNLILSFKSCHHIYSNLFHFIYDSYEE